MVFILLLVLTARSSGWLCSKTLPHHNKLPITIQSGGVSNKRWRAWNLKGSARIPFKKAPKSHCDHVLCKVRGSPLRYSIKLLRAQGVTGYYSFTHLANDELGVKEISYWACSISDICKISSFGRINFLLLYKLQIFHTWHFSFMNCNILRFLMQWRGKSPLRVAAAPSWRQP